MPGRGRPAVRRRKYAPRNPGLSLFSGRRDTGGPGLGLVPCRTGRARPGRDRTARPRCPGGPGTAQGPPRVREPGQHARADRIMIVLAGISCTSTTHTRYRWASAAEPSRSYVTSQQSTRRRKNPLATGPENQRGSGEFAGCRTAPEALVAQSLMRSWKREQSTACHSRTRISPSTRTTSARQGMHSRQARISCEAPSSLNAIMSTDPTGAL